MDNIFYKCVAKSIKGQKLDSYDIDLSESILLDQYQDQIVVLKSNTLKLGIVLEKEQVQFLASHLASDEWFDLSSLAYFLSAGKDDWVFENFKYPLSPQSIQHRIEELIAVFQKYEGQIVLLLTPNKESELKVRLLKDSINERWAERRQKLERKMRFPFF